MRWFWVAVACLVGCGDDGDDGTQSPKDGGGQESGEDGGATPDASNEQNDGGETPSGMNTVKATYSVSGQAAQTFTCVMEKFNFKYQAAPNQLVAGNCNNGAAGLDIVVVGFNVPAEAGTYTNGSLSGPASGMLLQQGTMSLTSGAGPDSDTTHSITVTSWSPDTRRIVGKAEATWTNTGAGAYGTLELSFDFIAEL